MSRPKHVSKSLQLETLESNVSRCSLHKVDCAKLESSVGEGWLRSASAGRLVKKALAVFVFEVFRGTVKLRA
jgi:hypothetical protein